MLSYEDGCFYYLGEPILGSKDEQNRVLSFYISTSAMPCCSCNEFVDFLSQAIYDKYLVMISVFDQGWICNQLGLCSFSYELYDTHMKKYYKYVGKLNEYYGYKTTPVDVDCNIISRKWKKFCNDTIPQ